MPIVGGTILVALEQQDASGPDVIFEQAAADANGNFNFCPLPTGTFDVVAVAINDAGLAYNATVAIGVPNGTNLGAIQLFAETASGGPATLQGFVTATTGSGPATIQAAVSALQSVTPNRGAARLVTIPAEGASVSNISVESSSGCPGNAPANSSCAQYTLIEPASNPSVGVFSAGKISYSQPAASDVLYSVRANALAPADDGTTDCMPTSKTVDQDTSNNPLKVTAGEMVMPKEMDFSGCT
jgi:hypothetical protein